MPSVTRQSDEHDDIPNPTPEQSHETSKNEVAIDDHQEQTDNPNDARDSEVINNIRYFSFINHYCFTVILIFFSFVIVEDKAV